MIRSNTFLLLFLTLMVFIGVQSQVSNLYTSLSTLVLTNKKMITQMISIKGNIAQNIDGRQQFMNTLKDLKQRVDQFIKSPLESPEPQVVQKVLLKVFPNNFEKANTYDPLMASYTLSENNNRRAWNLMEKITAYISRSVTPNIPMTCQQVKSTVHEKALYDLNEISIKNICQDILTCPKKNTLYSNKRNDRQGLRRTIFFGNVRRPAPSNSKPISYWEREKRRKEKERRLRMERIEREMAQKFKEQDVTAACTRDNQCNVQQALPMMTGVLRFQINEIIYQRLCPKNCEAGTCNYLGTYETVVEDIQRLIGFVASLPPYWTVTWNQFFQNAVAARAFSNPYVALSMVEGKKKDFKISQAQCLVKYAKACPTADIFQEYRLLKKMKQNRINDVKIKDLRRHSQMNYAQMIILQTDDMQHLELLGSIKILDDNLQASVAGISNYFEGLAKFDEGIAAADVGFIKGELDKYEKSLKAVETQLNKDISKAMILMVAVVGANLAEEIGKLAALIATNSNPLKLIFAGPDVMGVLDQAGAVANAASDLVRGTALIVGLTELAQDSLKLRAAFGVNSQQITSIDKVVKKIRNGESNNIGADADKFLEEYGAYTPQTDRASLAKNDALWSAFKDSMCDLLYGDVGVGGSVPKSIAGGQLICERLEGTLAQFFTLREDIFDFQFQLVDAITVVVRGNIAQRFATNIKGKHDSLEAYQLMSGSLLAQLKIQTISSVYCDVLEYKQLGKHVKACATVDGLFRKENLKALISYVDNTPYYEVERDVYIPTRAETQGDTGVIDLQALARGEKVNFKIPADQNWLKKYGWIIPGEAAIPFIKSLKVFLPHKTYHKGAAQRLLTTRITITSIAGSSVSTVNPNTGVAYILPKAQNTYLTIYEEGYSSCPKEINNPYSLCNNLPKICVNTRRISGQSLLPTVLSTFSLQVKIYQGPDKIDYDAPSPQKPLFLRAKAVFKVLWSAKTKSHLPGLDRRSIVAFSENGCCQGNRYRSSLYDHKCGVCPQGTTSYHGGLFCQINETPTQ